MIHRITSFVLICFFSVAMLSSCQQGGASADKAVEPISAFEYDYLVKEYPKSTTGTLEKGLLKEELYSQATKSKYRDQDANYVLTAYDIKRGEGEKPIAVLLKLDMDRVVSSLMGADKRQNDTEYFCIPSAKASEDLHKRFKIAVTDLGYKDYEVLMGHLTRLLAEVHL